VSSVLKKSQSSSENVEANSSISVQGGWRRNPDAASPRVDGLKVRQHLALVEDRRRGQVVSGGEPAVAQAPARSGCEAREAEPLEEHVGENASRAFSVSP
jgi:hypothetical protein